MDVVESDLGANRTPGRGQQRPGEGVFAAPDPPGLEQLVGDAEVGEIDMEGVSLVFATPEGNARQLGMA